MKTSILNSKLAIAALLTIALSSACGSKEPSAEKTNTQDSSSSKEQELNHATEPKEPAGTSYPGSTDGASTSTSTPSSQK